MTPPVDVLRAFGLTGEPEHLKGGISQTVWRVGAAVVKPVQEPNPGEGEWVAELLDAIEEDGFAVARPIRSDAGSWLVDGWTAWRWLDGGPCRNRWPDVTAAAIAFHRALPAAVALAGLASRPEWLDRRDHRWARAERTVWHGAAMPPTINTGAVEWSMFERALALGPPLTADELNACQVVHGDVAGNTIEDAASGAVGLIDMSPGWRTSASVDAQIAVEAHAWFGGDDDVLSGFDPADLARACGFRLLCGLQSVADWDVDVPGEIESWSRVLDLIGA